MATTKTTAPSRKTRVYLAGGKGDWRVGLEQYLDTDKFDLVDPFQNSRQEALYLFVHDDLETIRSCDLVLAYHGYPRFEGMAVECGFAHGIGIPIVFIAGMPEVPPLASSVSRKIFTDIKVACNYVDERFSPEALA